jgi:hypothetical protein
MSGGKWREGYRRRRTALSLSSRTGIVHYWRCGTRGKGGGCGPEVVIQGGTAMGEQQSWRGLIQSYLQACCDHDWQRRQERAATDWESSFLAEHGTPAMQQRHAESVQKSAAHNPVPVSPESITVIDESPDQITVEIVRDYVPIKIEQFPWFTTRFVLRRSKSGWLIDTILTPCLGCNSGYGQEKSPIADTPGKCILCRGTGLLGAGRQAREASSSPIETTEVGPCFACEGKGTCKMCAETETPGWRTAASVG